MKQVFIHNWFSHCSYYIRNYIPFQIVVRIQFKGGYYSNLYEKITQSKKRVLPLPLLLLLIPVDA